MTDEEKELAENLKSRSWRLANLYYIQDKLGREILFQMTPEQEDYYSKLWWRNIILKARQLGFTTECCIIQLDAALFEGAKCALIAHTLPDAKRLFSEKVKYAYDRLPESIRATIPAKTDRAGELEFPNGGKVVVSTSFRGGTLQWLHVSEFGKICAKFPEKAREIVTGAFPAAEMGVITLESTAEGRAGYYFDFCQLAQKLQQLGSALGRKDWRFFFYAWWKNPQYQIELTRDIPQRLLEYADELEQKGVVNLTDEQLAWYAQEEETLGDDMKREYPSTPGEAFEQSVQGAYYALQFKLIYKQKRITRVPHQMGSAVHTFWDIGVSDHTSIWFVQEAGRGEYHAIDFYQASGYGLDHFIEVLNTKRTELGYSYGLHVGPHDLAQREWGNDGISRIETARKKGIQFQIAPSVSVADGIDAVRRVLPRCWFDESRTEEGVTGLEAYRKEWDANKGDWKKTPLHDWSSHPSDSFRYFAVSIGLLTEFQTEQFAPSVPVAAPVSSAGWT